MLAFKAIVAVIVNLIVYYAFGSLLVSKNDSDKSPVIAVSVGFFAYYSLFALFVLPIMLTFRPLSLLAWIWAAFVMVIVIISIVSKGKMMACEAKKCIGYFKTHPVSTAIIGLAILTQVMCIVLSYDFTLDAAYYVANVTTSVDTNMINVYDPFTGAWQDHFELRYAFATYSINDAVVCYLTKIPALIQTKTVMAATVAFVVDFVYLGICSDMVKDDSKKLTGMMVVIIWINYSFITIYTASNFLMTRTYEGKAIVGNLTLVLIFWLFIKMIDEISPKFFWLMLFLISFGSATISSSANMLVPAELTVLLFPYIIKHKKWSYVWKYILIILPPLVMLVMYVLYVKGYYAIYTYTRHD